MEQVFVKFLGSISEPLPLFMLLVLIGMFALYCREIVKRDIVVTELRRASEVLTKLTTLIDVLVGQGRGGKR